MTMKRYNGVDFLDLTLAKRWNGTTWVDLTLAKRYNGVDWIDIALPGGGGGGGGVSATASDGSLTTVGNSGETCPEVYSQSCTVTASGGTGPYTYAWTYVSGSASIICNGPTLATTSFYASICHGTRSGTWRCTVTDSLGATDSVNVAISLTL